MSGHHISSAKLLWGVTGVLLILTFITVAVTWIQIPEPWNVVVAIGIAVIKGTMVALFYMNLWWDTRFNILLLLFAVLFLLILFGITLLDTLYRVDPVPSF